MEIRTNTKIGDKVYWIKDKFNKDGTIRWMMYEATVENISLCEYQGALYCELHCPSHKVNPYPVVHYSYVFHTKEEAEAHRKEMKNLRRYKDFPMCDGCKYAWKGRGV